MVSGPLFKHYSFYFVYTGFIRIIRFVRGTQTGVRVN
jgi:hypothetical protein